MDGNTCVIVSVAILAAIWIMLKLMDANDTINRAFNWVQLNCAWQAQDEKKENRLGANPVVYSPPQNSRPRERPVGSFQEEVTNA